MPNFRWPDWWNAHRSQPEPEPEPERAGEGAVARWPEPDSAYGQPAPPAQPLDTPPPDPPPPPPLDELDELDILPPAHDPLPDDPPWRNNPTRCYVCGRKLHRARQDDVLCWRCECVGDVAFAVYCGELSEWPGSSVNDRVMMATHPHALGLRKVPWQATVTAILSAAGVWLEDGGSE